MAGVSREAILRLEERSFNAWPALEVALVEGWLLRFAEGYSKRANSASALMPVGTSESTLMLVQEQYRARGVPCCFRLTPLAPPRFADFLAARGWRELDETSVEVVDLHDRGGRSPGRGSLQTSGRPTRDWIAGYARASARADLKPGIAERMLRQIATPATFAVLLDTDGVEVAYGMAVLDRGMVGLFDIVTRPDQRGRGYGRTLVDALLAWGHGQGAHQAYLQVTTANAPALALYRSFGFREVYRYAYRVPGSV